MDKDIIALQEALAHQSHEIENLSAELYRQQKELSAVQTQVIALITKLRALEDSGATLGPEPPPPHY